MHTNATIWGISCSLSLKVKYVIYTTLSALNRIAKITVFETKFKLFMFSILYVHTKDISISRGNSFISILIHLKGAKCKF